MAWMPWGGGHARSQEPSFWRIEPSGPILLGMNANCCDDCGDDDPARGNPAYQRVHALVRDSMLTCPACGTTKTEPMPADACQIAYQCTGCGVTLRPKPGDCCVFCSY